jgi:ketopantoate hydroxymethyltransferase
MVFQSNGFLTVPGGFHCQGKTQSELDKLTEDNYPLSPAGTIVFNLTIKKHQAFDGTSWHNLY